MFFIKTSFAPWKVIKFIFAFPLNVIFEIEKSTLISSLIKDYFAQNPIYRNLFVNFILLIIRQLKIFNFVPFFKSMKAALLEL